MWAFKVTLQALSRFGGMELDLMGRRSHLLFLGRGGQVVQYRGVIKGKSPDFRSPEVGISVLEISAFRRISACKEHHSCETALLHVQNDILKSTDAKQCIVLLLLDLSAAFDTLRHFQLLPLYSGFAY